MSYKNDKKYEQAVKRWRNSQLRVRDPAGYKKHQEKVAAYKKSSSSSKSDSGRSSRNKGGSGGSNKFNFSKDERRAHDRNIEATKDRIDELKDYKPKEMDLKRKTYSLDGLPERPNVPKLPKLNLPGGALKSTDVAKPSGLPGTIKSYTARPDYSQTFTAHKNTLGQQRKQAKKQKTPYAPGTTKTPKPPGKFSRSTPGGVKSKNFPGRVSTSAPGVSKPNFPNSTSKAPGVNKRGSKK